MAETSLISLHRRRGADLERCDPSAPLDSKSSPHHGFYREGATAIATPNTVIFVDTPSDDPEAAARFYAKVFGWVDDARLPGLFHRLNPGGYIRGPDGVETQVANLHFGASKAANRRPHPDRAGPEPRDLAGPGQKPRVWVLVGEGQSEAVMLETAVKLGGTVLWRQHYWKEFNGYCCSFADPWGNEFVLWSRGGPGAKALPGYTQE